MVLKKEDMKVFVSTDISFCSLVSHGLGDFACNSASKIYETSAALGWKHWQCCSTESPAQERGNDGIGYHGQRIVRHSCQSH